MKEPRRISVLLLERYNLGELTPEEKQEIEAALADDPALAERLEGLRRSDREIRAARPAKLSIPVIEKKAKLLKHREFPAPLVWGLCAALLLVIVLPVTRFVSRDAPDERAKGGAELSVYLKTGNKDTKLTNYAVLHEGNTVQLAYTVADDRYGVIFSLDGRFAVTLHYPYSPAQSTRLVSGRRTVLNEAYTLDDAPDYEIFFFVISGNPLDVKAILNSAESLARNPETAVERSVSVFKDYELQTVTLRKE
jgi:anti-sigma factor RsiW